jgi:hypothetical protein
MTIGDCCLPYRRRNRQSLIDMDRPIDTTARLRLLGCWLPLAQAVSASVGWREEPAALEALVLVAAPALAQARSAEEARAILTTCHSLLGRGDL